MKCNQMFELMPDLVLRSDAATPEIEQHLQACGDCAGKLEGMRKTMALLDQWQAPEPSPYFDVRLHARLREEEAAQASSGWLRWLRKPAMAMALTVLMAVGVTLFRGDFGHHNEQAVNVNPFPQVMQPGTAVGDLSQLDKNQDLYSDFDLLDDLQVQDDVTANP